MSLPAALRATALLAGSRTAVSLHLCRLTHNVTHAMPPRPVPYLTERKAPEVYQYPDWDKDLEKDLYWCPDDPHRLTSSKRWRTPHAMMREGEWPWPQGIRGELPEHYKRRYMEFHQVKPRYVHFNPSKKKWHKDGFGVIHKVKDLPIPVTWPKESNNGLWGGEGVVIGFKKNDKKDFLFLGRPNVWKPQLMREVFYSEILNQHMAITCTARTLDLVDEAHGFDHYILGTHQVDLRSKLGMTLKRFMLLALARGQVSEEVAARYAQYAVPEKEADWVGLTLHEACRRQERLNAQAAEAAVQPLKQKLAGQLLVKLSRMHETEDSDEAVEEEFHGASLLEKLNPFKKGSKPK